MAQAVRYIRMRETAAYRRISMRVVRDNRATVQAYEIKGRFDLITLNDAKKAGCVLNTIAEKLWNKCQRIGNELLHVEILDSEIEAPLQEVTVKTEDNKTVSMVHRPRRRKIDDL